MLKDLDYHAALSYDLIFMAKIQSFLQILRGLIIAYHLMKHTL